ncbi:hypothetical protein B0I33_103405 [Prauserella shujinwangii]|uniref:SnoaL-like domain-containing protein n=1 Tax=Prauserella shujinwangii TaxID=1453103 RepID=A0A2T0LZ47_9PSEU|nr:nuclear transport factor 2 family protein [Prauserella shujinwangii]PRX49370.1 hypothetical protein B0I33_103405 [Prauserella shujinwangii]
MTWCALQARPFLDCLADDVRWTVIGTTAWSGVYAGRTAVLNELLRPLGSRLQGRTVVVAHRFVAEGDLVVVEARGQNTTTGGAPYHNTYCWVCRVVDGRIRELTEYADTQLIATVLDPPGD